MFSLSNGKFTPVITRESIDRIPKRFRERIVCESRGMSVLIFRLIDLLVIKL
jgi:hypothetical protein